MREETGGLWDDAVHPPLSPQEAAVDRIAARLYEVRYSRLWEDSSASARAQTRKEAAAILNLEPDLPEAAQGPGTQVPNQNLSAVLVFLLGLTVMALYFISEGLPQDTCGPSF